MDLNTLYANALKLKGKSYEDLFPDKQIESEQIPKQEPILIQGEPVQPLEYPEKYKSQVPQTEIIRENINRALQPSKDYITDLEGAVRGLSQESGEQRRSAVEALKQLQNMQLKQYESPEIDTQLEQARKKLQEMPEPMGRDTTSEMILNLGPALGGLLFGEAGALAAPVAGVRARENYESLLKTDMLKTAQMREAVKENIANLIAMKKSGQEAFTKNQEAALNRGKAILSASTDIAKMSQNELLDTQKQLIGLNRDISELTGKGALEMAKMERGSELEKGKMERAKIIATGQDLKEATALRKEFYARPEVKEFADVSTSYDRIKKITQAAPSAAGDMSIIFSFMKMLDPTSVVREGEQATAENARGVTDSVRNLYNKVLTGQKLTPEQRKDFIRQAGSIYSSKQNQISGIEKEYKSYATQYGTSPSLVIGRPSEPLPSKFKDGDVKTIRGQQFVRRGGKWIPKTK